MTTGTASVEEMANRIGLSKPELDELKAQSQKGTLSEETLETYLEVTLAVTRANRWKRFIDLVSKKRDDAHAAGTEEEFYDELQELAERL